MEIHLRVVITTEERDQLFQLFTFLDESVAPIIFLVIIVSKIPIASVKLDYSLLVGFGWIAQGASRLMPVVTMSWLRRLTSLGFVLECFFVRFFLLLV